jgi:hypothetical protein
MKVGIRALLGNPKQRLNSTLPEFGAARFRAGNRKERKNRET